MFCMFYVLLTKNQSQMTHFVIKRILEFLVLNLQDMEVSSDFLAGLSDYEIRLCTFTNMVMDVAFTRNPLTSFVVS